MFLIQPLVSSLHCYCANSYKSPLLKTPLDKENNLIVWKIVYNSEDLGLVSLCHGLLSLELLSWTSVITLRVALLENVPLLISWTPNYQIRMTVGEALETDR